MHSANVIGSLNAGRGVTVVFAHKKIGSAKSLSNDNACGEVAVL